MIRGRLITIAFCFQSNRQVTGNFYGYVVYRKFLFEVTVELGNLAPNKEYRFVYVPLNTVSECFPAKPPMDQPMIFSTADATLPSIIEWLYQSGATGGGIRVEWDIPVDVGSDGNIFYQLYMSAKLKNPEYELVYNGTETHFWKTNLDSERAYNFMVSCLNTLGYSGNSSEVMLNTTFISVPGPMGPLTKNVTTGGMIYLSWIPPLDNGGNEVTSYLVNGDDRDVEVAGPEVVFGGLSANTEYTFTVYAGNALGFGTDGTFATFKTAGVSPPSVPPSIQVVKVSGGSVTLAIAVPTDTGGVGTAGLLYEIYANNVLVAPSMVHPLSAAPPNLLLPITSRRLELQRQDEFGELDTTVGVETSGYRRLAESDSSLLYVQVGSLLPTTAYSFTVKLGNAAGLSGLTNGILGDTMQVTSPDRPAAPKPDVITGGAMSLSWSDPVDTGGVPLTSYKLIVTTFGDEVGRCEGLIHSCEVGGLQSLTEYTAVLTAYNVVGASPPSTPVVYTTVLPTKAQEPQNPRVVAVTDTAVLVDWLPTDDFGGNYVESYYVEVRPSSPLSVSVVVTSVTVPIPTLIATVPDLLPNVNYYATIVSRSVWSLTPLSTMQVSNFCLAGYKERRWRSGRGKQARVLHDGADLWPAAAAAHRMWYVVINAHLESWFWHS